MAFSLEDREKEAAIVYGWRTAFGAALLNAPSASNIIKRANPFVDPKDLTSTTPRCSHQNSLEEKRRRSPARFIRDRKLKKPPVPIRSPLRTVSLTQAKKEPKPLQASDNLTSYFSVSGLQIANAYPKTRLARQSPPEQQSKDVGRTRVASEAANKVSVWNKLVSSVEGGRKNS